MKPSRTRLTCRAHNRFSPSIVLWQHFVGPGRPLLSSQRPSSTAAEPTQDGAVNNAQLEAQNTPTGPEQHGESSLKIRRLTTARGTWHPSKVETSIARNLQHVYATRQSSMNAPERLLATARAAFAEGRDYDGVVVQPMQHPTSVNERALPWSLAEIERGTMAGFDRLGVEIDRFYQFSQPNYYEVLARNHLIEQVQEHVRQTLPTHDMEVFGSVRTGIALATSDIDIRLIAKGQPRNPALARKPPGQKDRFKALQRLRKLYWDNLSQHKAYLHPQLQYARYPLISLQDRQSGLDVQIVLSNDTSLSRQIMKGYMEQYPYLQQLYCVVNTMFAVRGLNDVFRGGFGSYTIFMMIVASIRHNPHPRNDAAGGLINFLKFYRDFDTTEKGLSIEPVWQFQKGDPSIMTPKAKRKLNKGKSKPHPPYMLVLRDPADETNDLGRKAIAIKHVQATFKSLYHYLARDLAMNTRHSLLGPLVGASYMLNKERRQKTQDYGQRLSQQVQKTLAAKARRVRESEGMEQVDTQVKDNIKSNGSQGSRFEHFPTKEVNSTVEKRSIESTSLEEREGSTKI